MTEDRSTPDDAQRPEGEPTFSFTDKRKVNPEDGSVRPTGATPAAEGQGASEPVDPIDAEAAKLFEQAAEGGDDSAPADAGRVAELEGKVTELTEQLKRDQAEYVNSRRRIEAAAEVSKEAAIAGVLASLIGVLDDVELGRQHGDIAEGTPFHSIAQKLEEVLGSHGLKRFGAVGEEFDPNLHEALMHEDAEDVETPTISLVMQPGYAMNDRILRPARVGTRGPA
ncbi:molecular chaperone GrpE (heat shock protein) [Brachybacterium faecium DSM 4810]|uniref:Protein GrpE n=1 Tax=Brachybacterium faecium (strain ATCC 43885 / DSM 4810 / JCM 11609 / LMG 19847 / NBRC 14762 / NCIMB 9860 / 6-10) TaxID=446465 RepID=C7MBV3_BRAFD|nr:nucleotide exchange factor GrpE [Brachybacterium faecium]ACU85060.1 molecular chaperone GrpE (heat shock protein) [Brachybacterium faecium DSM 4810]